MKRGSQKLFSFVLALGFVTSLVVWYLELATGPSVVLVVLATTMWPLASGWKSAWGTALRPVVAWAAVSVLLAMAGQVRGMGEPYASGRPWAGHLAYLAALAALAALISALNARKPGQVAWAMLMGLLVLVFLIPWLEAGLGTRSALARLRLETPWTWFYLLLLMAGVTNYLPTRFGLGALALGLGLLLEFMALIGPPQFEQRALAWSAWPWLLALAIWLAYLAGQRGAKGRPGLERLWLWFRDGWGVVWALRVQERFNRSATILGWPVRLWWFGAHPTEGESLHESAEVDAGFRALLRRFADPERLDLAANPHSGPCQEEGPP